MNIDYKSIHRGIIVTLLTHVLGKYMKLFDTDDFYPVIVGGQNVRRCGLKSKAARSLIDGVFSSDIDIDFVITRDIKDNSSVYVKRAMQARLKLLEKVLRDIDLKKYIQTIHETYAIINLRIDLEIDTKMMKLPASHDAYKSRVIRIKANYYINNELQYKAVVIDTSMFSLYSKGAELYNAYRIYKRQPYGLPIPCEKKEGVYYAGCEHAYFDTARMLVFYASHLDEITDKKRLAVIFEKYANLIVKFVALYTLINRVKMHHDEYKKLRMLYSSVKKLLTTIEPDVLPQHKTLLHKLFKTMRKDTSHNEVFQQFIQQMTPRI
jgi:hypothetical protein